MAHRHDRGIPTSDRTHADEPAERRRAEPRSGARSAPIDATDRLDLAAALDALRARADGGESVAVLQVELLDRLVPWARRHAERTARRLPPWADRDELTSQVLGAVWHCCQLFDPERAGEWGALLWTRVRGAALDAARADDPLSRRQRQRLAAEGVPNGGAWRRPVALDDVRADQAVVSTSDPASEVIASEVAVAVDRWLHDDLPEDVAGRLVSWWHRTGAVSPPPPNLARAIDNYVFRLAPAVAMIRG